MVCAFGKNIDTHPDFRPSIPLVQFACISKIPHYRRTCTDLLHERSTQETTIETTSTYSPGIIYDLLPVHISISLMPYESIVGRHLEYEVLWPEVKAGVRAVLGRPTGACGDQRGVCGPPQAPRYGVGKHLSGTTATLCDTVICCCIGPHPTPSLHHCVLGLEVQYVCTWNVSLHHFLRSRPRH